MTFSPVTHTLKNNQVITIRSAEITDAENLVKTVKEYITDSDYIPKTSDEFRVTVKQEEDWISSFIEKDNSLLLVAVHNDQIIGNLDITGHTRICMQHTAVVGMGMLSNWRNSGLGTALMESGIGWAKKNPILELLWLQVYTENKVALCLYRKMNFTPNGIIKNYFKQEGKYYDNLTMSLVVQ